MVPKDLDYKVDLEAATVAIVTNEPERFGSRSGLTGEIAKAIKRRVVIRPCLLYTSDAADERSV